MDKYEFEFEYYRFSVFINKICDCLPISVVKYTILYYIILYYTILYYSILFY